MDRIFVQIASYRDTECQWTVKDLFEKATHPDRIFVGICWQYDPEEDAKCFEIVTRPDQVRISPFHWKDGKGVCWARHETQLLWEGEEYALFLDSHMRFEEGWDEKLIAELAECPSPKPVLTNHPGSYTPPDQLDRGSKPTVLRAHPYTEEGDLRFRGDFLDRFPEHPLRGAFIAAGFMFARSNIIEQVPYDPYLYFNQEELSLAARFYTHGFDVYSPKDVLIYHYYHSSDPARRARRLHWEDVTDWVVMQERARKRLDHLLGVTLSTDPLVTREMDKYGLGSERTLEEFEAFCGIDLRHRIVHEKALRCGFIENLAQYKDVPIFIPEIDGEPQPAAAAAPEPAIAAPATFPEAAVARNLPIQLASGFGPSPNMKIDPNTPPGVLIIDNYIDKPFCDILARYADSQAFSDLHVVNFEKSVGNTIATMPDHGRVTHHVDIDGMAGEILALFNDVYCNRLAAFYNVDFEWYERPQILRYPAGGRYNQHADADHWVAEKKQWQRVQDRDYSVLLYLNDAYEGGEIELVNQKFTVKPRPGMLLAFPSGHEFLHAALPTTSGIRYVIVSWAAVIGGKRMRPQMPYASIFLRQKRALLEKLSAKT